MKVMGKVIGLVALVSLLGLGFAVPAFAKSDTAEERLAVKAQIREEKRDEGSRPGLLKKFFDNFKSQAAIGTGTVTAISGTTFTVTKDGKSYIILTDSKTQFRRKFWGRSEIDEVLVGHTVNIIGRWTDENRTTIQARLIRDLSIERRFGAFIGVVQSLTDTGWVITGVSGNKPDQTVTVSSSTKFVNRDEQTIVKADVVVGHRIRVKGLWDKLTNAITDVTHVKDFSLPVIPTPTPTP